MIFSWGGYNELSSVSLWTVVEACLVYSTDNWLPSHSANSKLQPRLKVQILQLTIVIIQNVWTDYLSYMCFFIQLRPQLRYKEEWFTASGNSRLTKKSNTRGFSLQMSSMSVFPSLPFCRRRSSLRTSSSRCYSTTWTRSTWSTKALLGTCSSFRTSSSICLDTINSKTATSFVWYQSGWHCSTHENRVSLTSIVRESVSEEGVVSTACCFVRSE